MNTYLKISNNLWWLIKILLLLLHLLIGFLYIQHFHSSLTSREWEHINGITRIVIPDTFIYKEIIDKNEITNINVLFDSIVSSGIKNSAGPAMLWFFAGSDWYSIFFINLIFLIFIVQYMEGLIEQYSINRTHGRIAILVFLLMPVISYYSIGSLKELPMMLVLLGFLYHINAKQYKLVIVFIVIAFIFRYQLLVIFLLFIISIQFSKNQLKFILILLFGLSAFYPLLIQLDIAEHSSTELYRSETKGLTFSGEIVEYVRNNIIILSIFSIIIRTFQTLIEPFISLIITKSFYEDESFSIYAFCHVMSLIMLVPFIKKFAERLWTSIKSGNALSLEAQKIYSFVIILFIIIGGFSFIHHRYLVPIFPLLIIASLIPKKFLTRIKVNF